MRFIAEYTPWYQLSSTNLRNDFFIIHMLIKHCTTTVGSSSRHRKHLLQKRNVCALFYVGFRKTTVIMSQQQYMYYTLQQYIKHSVCAISDLVRNRFRVFLLVVDVVVLQLQSLPRGVWTKHGIILLYAYYILYPDLPPFSSQSVSIDRGNGFTSRNQQL